MTSPGAPNGWAVARVDIRARGLVQGIGFRYFIRREAVRLGLTGWVANRSDGSVQAVAEGPAGSLERFTEAVSRGPSGASVTGVELQWDTPTGEFAGFVVRAGSHPGD